MELIKKLLNIDSMEKLDSLLDKDKHKIGITNISEEFIYIISFLMNSKKDNTFIVLKDLATSQKFYDELSQKLDNVLFFPQDDFISSEFLISSNEFKIERVNTINNLLQRKKNIVVLNAEGLLKIQRERKVWLDAFILIKSGQVIEIEDLINKLISYGYERDGVVEDVGRYTRRGSIVDVFPPGDNPYRIEFFDDEIDTIRIYDRDTQMSIEKVTEIKLMPLNEFFYNEEEKEFILSHLTGSESDNKEDISSIKDYVNFDKTHKYLGLLNAHNTVLDLVDNKNILFYQIDDISRKINVVKEEMNQFINNNNNFNIVNMVSKENALERFDSVYLSDHNNDIFNKLVKDKLEIVTRGIIENTFAVDVGLFTNIIVYENNDEKKKIIEYLDSLFYRYFLISPKEDIVKFEINLINCSVSSSFELVKEKIKVTTYSDLLNIKKEKKLKYKSVFKNQKKLKNASEIKSGDFVVHYDYGIGKYVGIKTIELNNVKSDYLTVVYKGGDSLHVPLEKIGLLSKYEANEGSVPKLNKIGGTSWELTKRKTKSKIKELAIDLVKLYATREHQKGHKFKEDCKEQYMFEAEFPYETTVDQQRAIDDVKQDMESIKPMDRLICGDVGYGKTEVAIRAAFKSAIESKQVAYLTPTTVLSNQQYIKFKERFEKFGLRVELLNRYVTDKKEREILRGLEEGFVDVVVGTHKLLNNRIIYKDLGLLIVDEEQRFGVEHKEKIKLLKSNVDIITMTATPIPRTLQMSLMKIKEVSLIETAPKNRYPVQTYVIGYNEDIIKSAIEKELARDGQVFILYNKTVDIETFSMKINQLVPESSVIFAHGKMKRDALNNAIDKFIKKEHNILVCTTIIETGIDIQNANTIIIMDADKLGLSQLYQIRGRVGRGNKIAYAYLMFNNNKVIKEEASKRLKAIREFTDLGSGYKIAQRDLSIRGSGDILGSEQSGFIDGVGIRLYMKMLKEEIDKVNNVYKEEDVFEHKKFNVSNHIDKDLINDEQLSIEIHRKINSINSKQDIIRITREIKDRFGKVSNDLKIYMLQKLFEKYSKKFKLTKLEKVRNKISLRMDKDISSVIDGHSIFKAVVVESEKIDITYKSGCINISFSVLDVEKHYLTVLINIFAKTKFQK